MEELEEVIDLLNEMPKSDEIIDRLDTIIELLEEQKSYNQMQEEPIFKAEKTYVNSIEETGISSNKLGNYALIGFTKQEVVNYFSDASIDRELNYHTIGETFKGGDLCAILTNQDDDTVMIFDFRDYCKKEIQELLESAICNGNMNLIIGKGPSAQSIGLDFPKLNYILISNYEDHISNELMLCVDKVYQKSVID